MNLKQLFNLGLIAPIGYLAVTTIAINVGGLNAVPTMLLLLVAMVIGTYFYKLTGPVIFGPGVGGATVVAPILIQFGHTATSVAIATVGIIQLLLASHKTFLSNVKPPKDLKILILFVLGVYLLHKKDVIALISREAHLLEGNTPLLIGIGVFALLLIILALKPIFPNKVPKFISIGNILGLAFIFSIASVYYLGEQAITAKTGAEKAIHEGTEFWTSPEFWTFTAVLLIVEVLEGYFNYKSALIVIDFEEPPGAMRGAFVISGAMNLVAAVIGAGPVMTGLIKVSLYQESGGKNDIKDLITVFVGTCGIVVLYIFAHIGDYFAKWLFASLLIFVGLKLLVKGVFELRDHMSHHPENKLAWMGYWLLGVGGVTAIIFLVHDNALMFAIVFCIAICVLFALMQKFIFPKHEIEHKH